MRGADYSETSKLRDYVLDEFTPDEAPLVQRNVERAVDALFLFARGDLRRAMNEFNREPEEEKLKIENGKLKKDSDDQT